MTNRDGAADDEELRLIQSLRRCHEGDAEAREYLLSHACDRMRLIAHRMLPSFPTVQRWDQTDDVVQNAALRLCRALADVKPATPRAFIGLAALQIRRELLDLAKHHARAGSYAANHETNCRQFEGELVMRVEEAAGNADPDHQLNRWTRLHEAAESLPDEERELFHLAWYMGLSQEDASSLLGCSVRTVKRRWESAKNLIAKATDGEMPE